MTEDEAKTKWCPFVRIVNFVSEDNNAWATNQGKQSRTPEEPLATHCIASACMAWREIKKQTTPSTPDEVLGGYCGLAGRP